MINCWVCNSSEILNHLLGFSNVLTKQQHQGDAQELIPASNGTPNQDHGNAPGSTDVDHTCDVHRVPEVICAMYNIQ